MPRFSIGKIIGFLLLCLVVGWLLSVFGVTPENFWQGIVNLAQAIATGIMNMLEGSWGYLIAGAAVVVPIYLFMLIYRRLKRR